MVATVTRLKMAATTVHYFESDGYYARNDPAHRKASRWHGEAAAALGLRGPVKPQRFEKVLQGYVPGTDIRLGRLRDGEHQHRPGIDVTFSAPKSVSLEALVYAAPRTGARVLRAHDEAVEATLSFIEMEFLQTRSFDPITGQRPRVKANGMAAAAFRHLASRNLDPQLHTHCVIANMTRDRSGRWRSAEFTAVQRAKKLIGAHYRNELQRRLLEIGYVTVPTMVGGTPGFEIAGYDRATLEHFSTRRTEALTWMAERNWDYTPARMQQAVLYTRKRKQEPERHKLETAWKLQAREIGPKRDWEAARGRRRLPNLEVKELSALEVVRRGVEHLEERHTVFTANELRAWALGRASGDLSLKEVDAAIAELRRDGHLVEAMTKRGDAAFVTDRAVTAEREIIAWMRKGISASAPIAKEANVEARLKMNGLSQGQSEAVRSVLLSPHRLVAVQGFAGTGKTDMLREVVKLAEARRIVNLAPSARATAELECAVDTPARTLQWFLRRYRDIGDGIAKPERMRDARAALDGGMVIVDEASMISTTQMQALTRILDQVGAARLVLVGDRRQLRSVEAGQPFVLLQEAGMPTVEMDEVRRQREPGLKAAVQHLIARQPALAVEGLGNGVLEMDGDELGETAARLWLDLDSEGRANTEVLAPTHELRAEINAAVREGLAAEGAIHGRVLELERFVNLHLTRAQKGDPGNYREGDVAVFHHDVYGVSVQADDACRVAGKDEKHVLLDHPDGRVRRIEPSGYIRYRLDLYETEPIRLQAGDVVRWTRNDGNRRLINGEQADVVAVGWRGLRVRTRDGRRLSFHKDDPQLHHLDYAYSSTVHAAQGVTCDNVIAVLDSNRGPLTDQATFYVEVTRARDTVVLLTDDKEELVRELETRTGEELSALEAIGEQFATPAPAPMAVIRDREAHSPELTAWRTFAERVGSEGKDLFEAEGYAEVVAPILELAGSSDSPDGIPDDIVRIAAEHAKRQKTAERLENVSASIQVCLEERVDLVLEEERSGTTLTEFPDWTEWCERAQSTLAAGREQLEKQVRQTPEDDVLQKVPTRIEDNFRELERVLRFDEQSAALLRDWKDHVERAEASGVRPFYSEGCDELVNRIEAFQDEIGSPGKPGANPLELEFILGDHYMFSESRELTEHSLAIIRNCSEERRSLLEEAGMSHVPFRSHDGSRYALWQETAERAEIAGKRLLEKEHLYAPHLDDIEGARSLVHRTVEEIERAKTHDVLPGWLVGELDDHFARSEAVGAHPYPSKGYERIIAGMERLSEDQDLTEDARSVLKNEIAAHENRQEAQETLSRNQVAVQHATSERKKYLQDAEEKAVSLTALDGYEEWRKNTEEARATCREILRDTDTYGIFLEHRPDEAVTMENSIQELDQYLQEDDREIALHEQKQKRSRERKVERDQSMGWSM